MMGNYVTPDQAIELLNDMLETDKEALEKLVNHRVDCNGELAEHETIQVRAYGEYYEKTGKYQVGMLGVLNGIFGMNENGIGQIVMAVDADGDVDSFLHIRDVPKETEAEKHG